MKLLNAQVMGTAIVFGVPGREGLYKVEVCEVAAGGDWRMVQVYEPSRGGWHGCELARADNGDLMQAVETAARSLAHDTYGEWVNLLSEAGENADSAERVKELAEIVMAKFGVSKKQLAERFGMTPTTLRNYLDGKANGPTLVLALEALANRSKFL